jgi:intracellular sulfur oxidation DsrE/DsrF family protein
VDSGRAAGKTFDQVVAELRANLVPGAFLIPAAVGEIGRLQQRGFPYIYVPKAF